MQPAVTQSDLARLAGVSRGLVSLALADSPKVAEATKARIRAIADELGYSRNFGAAALASSSSTLVGVVLPNLRNPYFESLMAALQQEAEERGLTVLAATASSDESREVAMLEHFHAMRVGGVVLATPSRTADFYGQFASRVPLVIAGSPYVAGPAHVVHIDEHHAARQIVERAQAQGWEECIYVSPPLDDGATRYRQSAIRAACDAADVPLLIVGAGERLSLAESIAARLRKVCVIAHHDLSAIDLVSLALKQGWRIGDDVSLVSYDNTFLASYEGFDLTSVDQQPRQQARRALDAIAEPGGDVGRDLVVEPRLVARTSG